MKLLRALLLAMSLAVVVVGTTLASPRDPFHGNWKSTDTDGSRQSMAFGGHADWRNVTLRDNDATACGGGTAVVKGKGAVADTVLTVTFRVHCASGAEVADTPYTFTYDSTTNTLTDSFGVVWSRPGHH